MQNKNEYIDELKKVLRQKDATIERQQWLIAKLQKQHNMLLNEIQLCKSESSKNVTLVNYHKRKFEEVKRNISESTEKQVNLKDNSEFDATKFTQTIEELGKRNREQQRIIGICMEQNRVTKVPSQIKNRLPTLIIPKKST